MEGRWCESVQGLCNPRDCNREFCKWRDITWVREQLSRWAYSDVPENNPPVSKDKPTTPSEADKK